ncbi:MAG: hypothetical protein RBU37_12940 [Myxococcota bacterium]|jgi:hypothetical protein|nr:hypothetical protein [Myxococcota bacterium]
MRTLGLSLVAVVFCTLSVGVAMAEETRPSKEIIFDDELIEGASLLPAGSAVAVREDESLTHLIKARDSFVDEMLKQVEDL